MQQLNKPENENNMNSIIKSTKTNSTNLFQQSKIETTIFERNVYDLTGNPLTPEFFGLRIKEMELNYEKKCPKEKYLLLFKHLQRERWTIERFDDAVHQLLKFHKWPTWTIADFYSVSQPTIFNHIKYLDLLNKNGSSFNESVNCYVHIPTKQLIYCYKIDDVGVLSEIEFKKLW